MKKSSIWEETTSNDRAFMSWYLLQR